MLVFVGFLDRFLDIMGLIFLLILTVKVTKWFFKRQSAA